MLTLRPPPLQVGGIQSTGGSCSLTMVPDEAALDGLLSRLHLSAMSTSQTGTAHSSTLQLPSTAHIC